MGTNMTDMQDRNTGVNSYDKYVGGFGCLFRDGLASNICIENFDVFRDSRTSQVYMMINGYGSNRMNIKLSKLTSSGFVEMGLEGLSTAVFNAGDGHADSCDVFQDSNNNLYLMYMYGDIEHTHKLKIHRFEVTANDTWYLIGNAYEIDLSIDWAPISGYKISHAWSAKSDRYICISSAYGREITDISCVYYRVYDRALFMQNVLNGKNVQHEFMGCCVAAGKTIEAGALPSEVSMGMYLSNNDAIIQGIALDEQLADDPINPRIGIRAVIDNRNGAYAKHTRHLLTVSVLDLLPPSSNTNCPYQPIVGNGRVGAFYQVNHLYHVIDQTESILMEFTNYGDDHVTGKFEFEGLKYISCMEPDVPADWYFGVWSDQFTEAEAQSYYNIPRKKIWNRLLYRVTNSGEFNIL